MKLFAWYTKDYEGTYDIAVAISDDVEKARAAVIEQYFATNQRQVYHIYPDNFDREPDLIHDIVNGGTFAAMLD